MIFLAALSSSQKLMASTGLAACAVARNSSASEKTAVHDLFAIAAEKVDTSTVKLLPRGTLNRNSGLQAQPNKFNWASDQKLDGLSSRGI